MSKYIDDLMNVSTFSPKKLSDYYKRICEVYAERLCEMYSWDKNDCYWVGDEIGGTFCSSGIEYSIKFDELRYLVDNCISFEEFDEYWTYNLLISYARENEPNNDEFHFINIQSWFHGCPRIDIEELRKQEDIYWDNYQTKLEIMADVYSEAYKKFQEEMNNITEDGEHF